MRLCQRNRMIISTASENLFEGLAEVSVENCVNSEKKSHICLVYRLDQRFLLPWIHEAIHIA